MTYRLWVNVTHFISELALEILYIFYKTFKLSIGSVEHILLTSKAFANETLTNGLIN